MLLKQKSNGYAFNLDEVYCRNVTGTARMRAMFLRNYVNIWKQFHVCRKRDFGGQMRI
jgi:hypothetical protein